MTERLADYATVAWMLKPRRFALYGLYHGSEEEGILGWGMDFRSHSKVLYFEPDGGKVHTSDNPDRLRRFYSRIADTQLEWLDPE
jgi:hypothetical protein